ncbi:hypothetical protein FRC03_008251 [Tulasnella sp. 419]|nr:hypothetical protein FRC03_008251 [Tulasnella sp. 419]
MHMYRSSSAPEGRIYDTEDPKLVVETISTFIETYKISLEDVLEPDIKAYKTFNSFFARRLKHTTRPVTDPDDPLTLTSVADCRLAVYQNVAEAKKFWIKGRQFSVASLLDDPHFSKLFGSKPSLAIFRLAPQDYHRYHAFTDVTLGKLISIPGTYYTVVRDVHYSNYGTH